VNPKDKQPEVQAIESPSGLDLHPQPEEPARVSRRAAAIVLGIVAAILLGYAYGGYRGTAKNEAEARQTGLPKMVAPATQAAQEFVGAIPPGNAPSARHGELPPPDPKRLPPQPCGRDPQTGPALSIQSPDRSALCRLPRAWRC